MCLRSLSISSLYVLACVVFSACIFKPHFLYPGIRSRRLPEPSLPQLSSTLVAAARVTLYIERFAHLDMSASQSRGGFERLPGLSWTHSSVRRSGRAGVGFYRVMENG